ncbi:DUF4214 domain-containing protein [Sulfitobacter sediminilitoris]|uniref:DUF4214 domain-containing protein n=1 Tax=Sulfitobacter sediminilitoris TaxID=2698830 RepID=UPI0036200D08
MDFSAATTNAVIDLRPATLALDPGGGGYLSFIEREGGTVANGGYTIAFGVEIENGLGGMGNDTLTGNTLANTLTGGAGNDMVTGAVGNDTINGGAGQDTGIYSGNQSSYTLMLSAQSPMLTDRRGTDGTDTLVDIEVLQFVDGTFDLDILSEAVELSAEDFAPIIELYIAYFNRAPDAVGLAFWGNAFAEGVSMQQMAAMFYDQNETRATYPDTMSNAEFVITIYNNVLGRGPDAEGFAFWWDHLNTGRLGRDTLILDVLGGAKVDPRPDATDSYIANLARDKQYLTDKTDIGAYFAITKGMSDLNDAAQVMVLFDGSQSSIDEALAAIESHYEDALSPVGGDFLMPLVGVVDDLSVG